MTRIIDINCDMGERPSEPHLDLELLPHITSANIACGGHAGDEQTMLITIRNCLAHKVAIGAHPGYPDQSNFGRFSMGLSLRQVEDSCLAQIRTLDAVAQSLHSNITHVKPHGALYHDAMRHEEIAMAIGRAAYRINPSLTLVAFPGSKAIPIWQSQGLVVATEAFADRVYEHNGSLRDRSLPDAVITDPSAAASQALTFATSPTPPRTICIHSDTTNAVDIASAVKSTLSFHGIQVRSLQTILSP